MSSPDKFDPHWLDEDAPDVECDWCGFVKCACDELHDAYEFQMEMIEEGR